MEARYCGGRVERWRRGDEATVRAARACIGLDHDDGRRKMARQMTLSWVLRFHSNINTARVFALGGTSLLLSLDAHVNMF